MSEAYPFTKIIRCVSRTNHVTSFDDLGSDIIMFEILARLPAKYVGRSRSVCKPWLACLSTHEFARTNSRHLHIVGNQKMLALSNRSSSIISLDIDSSSISTCTVLNIEK
ncbi:hypothetical protein L1987_31604 [Smallanthus sonchifolius]|uniref:Uncharacterized protein n=1 Tax=Smallanthus sonchifolius TaxID=185202 RepID=A0ACB9I5W9_9ASTR|nr:hypothetical protein L1987_31604 [Smallanthus sonchifolius]